MQIEYRVVKTADEKQIMDLYLQAGWWDDNPDNIITITKIIANSYCFVIAVSDERVIGMGRAISDGYSDAYIQDVTVLNEYRKQGIGKGIIRTIISFLRENKIQWIGLISEPNAVDFYESLGFTQMKDHIPFIYQTIN